LKPRETTLINLRKKGTYWKDSEQLKELKQELDKQASSSLGTSNKTLEHLSCALVLNPA